MNHSELVKTIAEKTGVSKETVKKVLKAQNEAVVAAVATGDSVAVHGFGTFKCAVSAARTGKNPATGETIQVPARKRLAFKASAGIKNILNGEETV